MRTYLVTRLLLVIPMVWILVTVVFFVMRVVGDPITSHLSGHVPESVIKAALHKAGYDKPLLTQYWDYISGIAQFDFGKAVTDNQPVTHLLVTRGAATLELTLYSLIVAFTIGVPLGRVAARYRDRLPDVILRVFAVLGYAMPVFFVGLLLQLLFAIKLGWLPPSGRASVDVEAAIQNVAPNTHIYLINADPLRRHQLRLGRHQARDHAGDHARPAHRWRVPAPRAGEHACRRCARTTSKQPAPAACRNARSCASTRSRTRSFRSSP